jgi:hypothetical protein
LKTLNFKASIDDPCDAIGKGIKNPEKVSLVLPNEPRKIDHRVANHGGTRRNEDLNSNVDHRGAIDDTVQEYEKTLKKRD